MLFLVGRELSFSTLTTGEIGLKSAECSVFKLCVHVYFVQHLQEP